MTYTLVSIQPKDFAPEVTQFAEDGVYVSLGNMASITFATTAEFEAWCEAFQHACREFHQGTPVASAEARET